MRHYTCTSCGLEAEAAGVCTNGDCLKEGQELTACDCVDGEHGVSDEFEDAQR